MTPDALDEIGEEEAMEIAEDLGITAESVERVIEFYFKNSEAFCVRS